MMLEAVKEQVWELLKEKDISLAMIYNKKGTGEDRPGEKTFTREKGFVKGIRERE